MDIPENHIGYYKTGLNGAYIDTISKLWVEIWELKDLGKGFHSVDRSRFDKQLINVERAIAEVRKVNGWLTQLENK